MAPSVQTFLNSFQNKLEPPVRQHLQNVYACLTLAAMAATAGVTVHLFTDLLHGGFMSTIGALAFLFLLMRPDDNYKNTPYRIGYLAGFAGCTGLGLGPLLEQVILIDPSIVLTALIGTTLVFVSFSIASLLAERGRWLYIGGTLFTLLNTLLFAAFANVFFRSELIYKSNLYLGLLLMCGFVLYDTQLIVEKRRAGNRDFVGHSLDLFIDFVGIFRRLVVILAEREENSQRKRKN